MNHEPFRNGGALRLSRGIHRRPAVNLHHAQRYAEMIGLPLRLFVTINFTLMDIPPDAAVLAFRTILTQRFAPWLRRSSLNGAGLAPTYVWVMEAAGGRLAAHRVLHVPSKLVWLFKEKLALWLSSITEDDLPPRALNIKPVTSPIGLRRYMLKGVDAPWAVHLGVRHVDQGIVFGKRSGFSRNLGPSARKSGGYTPRRLPLRGFAA
jgi:hypothetical protein